MSARAIGDSARLRGFLRQGGATGLRQVRELSRWLKLASSANFNRSRGRYDAALLDYARIIRDVQICRESMRCYRRIHGLVRHHPGALAAHQLDEQMPGKMLFFLGHSRSGHSLVGSLLDAHPQIVVSHELHALKHLAAGRSTAETIMAIKYNAYFYHLLGREYTGYDYQVPGQAQGRYRRLRIAGDKKGNGTVRILRRYPDLPGRLERELARPFMFVHVIRNPYDNIATKARRTGAGLQKAAQRYFANVDIIARLKSNYPNRVIDVYLDDLISAPEPTLRSLIDTLGIDEVPQTYFSACASILFKRPRRTAKNVRWSAGLLNSIHERLAPYPFLKRFRCENAQP